jgi:hypothetical protein
MKTFFHKCKGWLEAVVPKHIRLLLSLDTGGMYDWSYFDNSNMFDDWKVSFLRKNLVSIQPNT